MSEEWNIKLTVTNESCPFREFNWISRQLWECKFSTKIKWCNKEECPFKIKDKE